MKRTEAQKIGEIVKKFLEQNPTLSFKLAETRLLNSWNKVLGEGINRYTETIFIKNQTLYVKITSSVLKNELMMCRERLIKNLNEEAGLTVIDSIRFF